MPLFGRKSEPVPPQQQVPVQQTHHNTLRRGTRSSTTSNSPPGAHRSSRGGLFSRRRSDSSFSSSDYETPQRSSTTRSSIGNMFHRTNKYEDPAILAARERVAAAEQAEKDADIALQQARNSVREARDHVHRLVAEAEAEAKAARLKQGQAQDLDRRAKPLGRHDRFY